MEIKPIEPIVKTQISSNNNKYNKKSVKVEYGRCHDKPLGKTFEDYLNECMKSDDKIIKVDEFKKLDKLIPYINLTSTTNTDIPYCDIARVKIAYGY